MKPASIISLVIAVLLIIVGLVGCFIAQNMAQANGEYLFSESRGENSVQTIDLTESEISKIELICPDAEVNIYGRSEKSYIEFINFRENYYSLSNANRVLSFDEIPDVKSMLKFWENGFTFKGMRYILQFHNKEEEGKQKVINIYLTNTKDIKIFDIKVDSLKLNITNMTSGTDYNITTKNAVIDSSVLRTSSTFNINSAEGDSPADSVTLKLNTALVQNISVNAKELLWTADRFRVSGNAVINAETGEVNITTITAQSNSPKELRLDITTNGTIIVDGSQVQSPFTQAGSETPVGEYKMTLGDADVKISASDTEQGN